MMQTIDNSFELSTVHAADNLLYVDRDADKE